MSRRNRVLRRALQFQSLFPVCVLWRTVIIAIEFDLLQITEGILAGRDNLSTLWLTNANPLVRNIQSCTVVCAPNSMYIPRQFKTDNVYFRITYHITYQAIGSSIQGFPFLSSFSSEPNRPIDTWAIIHQTYSGMSQMKYPAWLQCLYRCDQLQQYTLFLSKISHAPQIQWPTSGP